MDPIEIKSASSKSCVNSKDFFFFFFLLQELKFENLIFLNMKKKREKKKKKKEKATQSSLALANRQLRNVTAKEYIYTSWLQPMEVYGVHIF